METVLIIDDSGINLRTAKEALDDYYNVVTANSCKMALRYLEKHTPDIILLDIQMPEVDGFETLKSPPFPATDRGHTYHFLDSTGQCCR